MKHHGQSTAGKKIASKFSAWNDLPDLEEFEYRLGRIQNNLESEINEQEKTEAVHQDRRRRREDKVIGSVLATGARKAKVYPALSSDDWERDLATDDDDQLPETLKKYAADPTIKGTKIAPILQSPRDFADDYPVDDDTDQAEDARLLREQQAREEEAKRAKEAANTAEKVVDSKKRDLEKAAKKTQAAKKKTQDAENQYSNATAALHKAKQDVKQGNANETRLKNLEKDIRFKVKLAEEAVMKLDRRLYKKNMYCKKLDGEVNAQNTSVSQKHKALQAQKKKLEELLKNEELANKEVKHRTKALQDAEKLLAKLKAKSTEEDGSTKSQASRCHFLSLISVSLVAAVL